MADSLIKRVVKGTQVVDGAGVRINRIIGSPGLTHIDPFMLLDEIRSDDPGDYSGGFPTHPHRGIETITYMVRGSFRHADSRGGGGLLTDGCVQWMTAGRGILHSEIPEDTPGTGHGIWGYQLWVSLPAEMKMTEPAYQHITPEMIPTVVEAGEPGVVVKVISGSYNGSEGPAKNRLGVDYFVVSIHEGAVFRHSPADGANACIYVHTGEVQAPDGTMVLEGELAELAPGRPVELEAGPVGAGILFLAARPNNEPIARRGPFVMNTEEEIRQAFEDYANGAIG